MMHFGELRWPGSSRAQLPAWARWANKVLGRLGFPVELAPRFDHRNSMVSAEQVANFQHLLERTLEHGIEGAVVELGCYTGSTTAVMMSVLQRLDPQRPFHVYDSFGFELGRVKGIRTAFEGNLNSLRLPLPTIHEGDFFETLPGRLPERIAFLHIDCGVGGDHELHARLVRHCLESAYPRMTAGAIGILMDYHVPGLTVAGHDSNPGVRRAADAFFSDKPGRMVTLYGGPCSHGWFRKA